MTEWPTGTVSGRYSDQRPNIDKQASQSYQEIWQECFDALMNADLSDIEQRILHSTRGTSKLPMLPYLGTSPTYIISDDQCETRLDLEPADDTGPKNAHWTQPIPTADPFNKPVSDPSQAKRAKLRAKRKKSS
jgi:hypothetical protein